MDQLIAARMAALHAAIQLNMANGVTCPGCLLTVAENITGFLLGGPHTIQHLAPDDEDDLPTGPFN